MKTFFTEYKYNRDLVAQIRSKPKDYLSKIIEPDETRTHPFAEFINPLDALQGLAESIMLAGYGTDYFVLTKELSLRIRSMVKDFDRSVMDVFADLRRTAFVIHSPSPIPAVLCGIFTQSTGTNIILCSKEGTQARRLALPNDFGRRCPESDMERMAVGLALYMRFFPKNVIDGIPDCAKNPTHYKGKPCAAVSVAEELICRSGPSPHIRQAHYRFLGSERYTHKRGEYVLVKETFVCGRCRIVIEGEEDK